MSIIGLVVAHTYAFIFFGLLFAGEVVLIPAAYAATLGYIGIVQLFLTAVIATSIADTFWYFVGKYISTERLWRIGFVRKREELIRNISAHFTNHQLKILFLSKAVYGTRTVIQVLSGMHHVPFAKYLSVNALGIVSWTAFIIIVASVIQTGLDPIREVVHGAEIAFVVFVGLVIVVNILVHRAVKHRWLR
ncbi:VTT domain-containing protein [Candidatus Wolfebacteria bacterium]|nr:VTT domain-containing protein [Candidatus Wolfebacteria bacterium]